jgi:2-polyprenyl-3-methyl-5-hydroxy-6-metoxy-1,4-benzoquinol methylase
LDEYKWLQLNDELRQIWNEYAPFWDEYMGEGNSFAVQLVYPVVECLLQTVPGEQVLEIACGNGNFSRRLAVQGIHVLATDFSTVFLERARKRSVELTGWIEYQEVDATDSQCRQRGRGDWPATPAVLFRPPFESVTQHLLCGWLCT